MSTSEIKDYCLTVHSYQIKVKVRLKNDYEKMIGKIQSIDTKHFLFKADAEDDVVTVPYISVASITAG